MQSALSSHIHIHVYVYLFIFTLGTRYRRRGIDSDGHVANFVETEVVVKYSSHIVAYVIVRGSVPVYWTQPGYRYRPPPIIENGMWSID